LEVDKSAAFLRRLNHLMVRRIGLAAEFIKDELHAELSDTGEPSRPGEYPKRQTGELVNSIRIKRRGLEALIGPTAEHAKYLAKSGRKLAPEFLAERKKQVARIIIKG